MKQISPIPLKEKYFSGIQREINRIFYDLIYSRLAEDIKLDTRLNLEIRNAIDPLAEALRDGIVWYDDGQFKGKFNAQISRRLRQIGARFNTISKTFSLSLGALPFDLRVAQAHAELRYENLRKSLLQTLEDINVESINKISDIPDRYYETINWMNEDFQKTIKSIAIPPQLTEAQRGMLAAEWGQNLDKYVKNWAQENILKLRTEIQANAFAGRRSSSMVKYIQQNYRVSQRKAEFLARQETSLLMSKFHETRYKDIGVTKYKWSGSMDGRERLDHKELEGKIFSWDQPPVVDKKTGRRGNPGEDFGCRCVAIPLVE